LEEEKGKISQVIPWKLYGKNSLKHPRSIYDFFGRYYKKNDRDFFFQERSRRSLLIQKKTKTKNKD
jgi:hypothetical protein